MTPLARIIREGIVAQVEPGDAEMLTDTAIDVFGPFDLNKLAEFIDKKTAEVIDKALRGL